MGRSLVDDLMLADTEDALSEVAAGCRGSQWDRPRPDSGDRRLMGQRMTDGR